MKEGTIKLGRGKYERITAQQNEYFFDNLKDIINTIRPKRIIEIGTSRGATTLLMSDILSELNLTDTLIKTFDIKQPKHLSAVSRDNVEFYLGNIFNYSNETLTNSNEITDFITNDGVNLIMCDGGNKKSEFNTLTQYLNTGDIIMAHDYAPDLETFRSDYVDKIWNFMEISEKDIRERCEEHNLITYRMDLFKQTAWIAKIKQQLT